MKPSSLLSISLGLNLVLLIAVAAVWNSRQADEPKESIPAVSQADASNETSPAPARREVVEPAPDLTPRQQFDWQAVESEDYRQYVANLRAIGCPEQTIRDIIVADVNKLYEERLKDATAKPPKFEYWKTGLAPMIDAMANEEQIERSQELGREKRQLLRTLLGQDYEEKLDLTSLMGGVNPFERILDFLPAGKQTELMELEQRYGVKLAKEFGGGVHDNKDRERLLELQREKDAEIAQILTPDQKDKYDLRLSQTAQMMRVQLEGFEPTREEFEQIFALRKEYDDRWGWFGDMGVSSEDRETKRAEMDQLNSQVKELLGEDRFREYERAQNWEFKGILKAVKRQGLDRSAAHQVFDLKEIAEQQAGQLRGSQNLDPAQRAEALRKIRVETETAMAGILGQEEMSNYRENQFANWLDRIHRDEPPSPTTPAPPGTAP